MKAKRNENGKIELYLCRDMGNNFVKVSEHDTLNNLRKEGRRLLKAGAYCANNFPAREFWYERADGSGVFEWI